MWSVYQHAAAFRADECTDRCFAFDERQRPDGLLMQQVRFRATTYIELPTCAARSQTKMEGGDPADGVQTAQSLVEPTVLI